VRCLLDEVFGRENFVAVVAFKITTARTAKYLNSLFDFLLWYAKDRSQTKYRQLFEVEIAVPDDFDKSDSGGPYYLRDLSSQGTGAADPFEFAGRFFRPPVGRHWSVASDTLPRLTQAERVEISGNYIRAKIYHSDFPVHIVGNVWLDTQFGGEKYYAVQTHAKVIERCILMTTDPGDLVFDPTCGSGTTAFCAEKWGRRWITCDTSRVALQIARQRLMTAKFDYFELLDPERGPAGGFKYETVPHITLESIAKNPEIDVIAAKFQPEIDAALKALNKALGSERVREILRSAQNDKSRRSADSGKRSALEEWEVPREVGKDWPREAKEAHRRFWEAKRRKRQEIDASIQRNAPQETLYDRPFKKSGVVRVTGPFTVEAIPAPAIEAPAAATPIPQFETSAAEGRVDDRAGDYLTNMIGLLRQQGGVLFPKGKKLELANIRPLNLGPLHAEAEASQNGKSLLVAISFGPQYGPVIAVQAHEAIQIAKANAYDILLIAGFSFEAEAQAFVQKAREMVRGLDVQFANIAPDVLVGDLLKTSRTSQIFTAYGQPDVHVRKQKDGTFVVELAGVDIYDPLTGETHSASGEDVAAWFLDTDYDGMTFHICQAFFPGDKDAWDKLQRALKAQIEPEAFAQMRSTKSFPFKAGKHGRIAVKVIDFRGNEVMGTRELGGKSKNRTERS